MLFHKTRNETRNGTVLFIMTGALALLLAACGGGKGETQDGGSEDPQREGEAESEGDMGMVVSVAHATLVYQGETHTFDATNDPDECAFCEWCDQYCTTCDDPGYGGCIEGLCESDARRNPHSCNDCPPNTFACVEYLHEIAFRARDGSGNRLYIEAKGIRWECKEDTCSYPVWRASISIGPCEEFYFDDLGGRPPLQPEALQVHDYTYITFNVEVCQQEFDTTTEGCDEYECGCLHGCAGSETGVLSGEVRLDPGP